MSTPNDPTISHDALDAVIAAYMLAVEAGHVPNRQELLDCHPEHADAPRAFFADLDRMDRVASPLRLADGLDATNAIEANGHTELPTVRYFGDYELLEDICAQAAKLLTEALGRETDARARSFLASALSTVAGRIDSADAARVCGGVMRLSVQKGVVMAPAGGPWDDSSLVPELLRYLDLARAKALTREVVMGLVSKRNVNELGWSEILNDISTAEISRRAGLMTMMIGRAASGQFAWAEALAAEPFPCRLTTQELVDLLKMPTCLARRGGSCSITWATATAGGSSTTGPSSGSPGSRASS